MVHGIAKVSDIVKMAYVLLSNWHVLTRILSNEPRTRESSITLTLYWVQVTCEDTCMLSRVCTRVSRITLRQQLITCSHGPVTGHWLWVGGHLTQQGRALVSWTLLSLVSMLTITGVLDIAVSDVNQCWHQLVSLLSMLWCPGHWCLWCQCWHQLVSWTLLSLMSMLTSASANDDINWCW